MEEAKGCSLEAGEAKGTLLPWSLQKDLALHTPGFHPVRLIPKHGPAELGDSVCVLCSGTELVEIRRSSQMANLGKENKQCAW